MMMMVVNGDCLRNAPSSGKNLSRKKGGGGCDQSNQSDLVLGIFPCGFTSLIFFGYDCYGKKKVFTLLGSYIPILDVESEALWRNRATSSIGPKNARQQIVACTIVLRTFFGRKNKEKSSHCFIGRFLVFLVSIRQQKREKRGK